MKYKKFKVFTKEVYPSLEIYDPKERYDRSMLNKIRSEEVIDYELHFPYTKVDPQLNYLPDLVSGLIVKSLYCVLCSNKFLDELSLFNIPQHSIFDANVIFQNQTHQYNYIHFPYRSNEMIDFPNCKFSGCAQTALYANPKKNKWVDVPVSSIEDFELQYETYNMRCEQLALKKDNELDFFWILIKAEGSISGFYISERCATHFKNKKLTGFELIDI